jgi:hypothetical protein
VLAAAATAEASIATPPPVPAAAIEEGEMTTEAVASHAVLITPTKAGPGGADAVVVLDEDLAPPPSSENRDVVMPPTLEPAQVATTASLLPAVGIPEPSAAAEVSGPPQTAEVAETSSARGALTAKEVMELATCRYIDFPGVGVIDLEEPQLPEKVFEVASERMFNKPTIMEMIASVSKALQEYERVGGFSLAVAAEAADAALVAPAAHVESTADASVPPPVDEGREALPPRSAEAVEAPASIAEAGAMEAVVREDRSSLPRPVAADAEGVETRVPDEPAAIVQESVAPRQ